VAYRPSALDEMASIRADELLGQDVALGLPSFVVPGTELGDRRRAQGDSTELNDDGERGVQKVREPHEQTLLAERYNAAPVGGPDQ
jgi:hypothetical protein